MYRRPLFSTFLAPATARQPFRGARVKLQSRHAIHMQDRNARLLRKDFYHYRRLLKSDSQRFFENMVDR